MIRTESSETFGAFSGCCGYGKDLRGRKGFVTIQHDSGAYLTALSPVFPGEPARGMAGGPE
jgi:hypothetical protein